MKQIVMALCVLFLSGYALGQNIIEKNFRQYKEQDNFTKVHVASKAFELTAYMELEDADEDFEEFRQFLSTVKSFDMIAGREVTDAANKYRAALKKVQATHEELMNVVDEEGSFTFLIDESNGVVRELVMVGTSDDKLLIFSLTGNMDMTQLSKMSRLIHSNGHQQMRKMFDNGLQEVKVYPNPVKRGAQLTFEVPAEMLGGTARLLNMNGAVVKTYQLSSDSNKLETNGLAAGNYILEFKSENVSIRKKLLIQ